MWLSSPARRQTTDDILWHSVTLDGPYETPSQCHPVQTNKQLSSHIQTCDLVNYSIKAITRWSGTSLSPGAASCKLFKEFLSIHYIYSTIIMIHVLTLRKKSQYDPSCSWTVPSVTQFDVCPGGHRHLSYTITNHPCFLPAYITCFLCRMQADFCNSGS